MKDAAQLLLRYLKIIAVDHHLNDDDITQLLTGFVITDADLLEEGYIINFDGVISIIKDDLTLVYKRTATGWLLTKVF